MKIKSRAVEKYRKDGLTGIIRRLPSFVIEESPPYRNFIAGRIIELKGNSISYNDVKLNLSSKHLSTQLKGRFWFGEYEDEESKLVEEHLPQDKPVIELGGCIGYISCKINHNLDDPSQHVVLEGNPNLITSLEKNKQLNNSEFEIINKAYSTDSEKIEFHIHDKFVGGSVQRETGNSVEVECLSIEDILENKQWEEFSLVCDIEGGEYELFEEEISVLKDKSIKIIVEIHAFGGNKDELENKLREEFQVEEKIGNSLVLKP
jgi:FkbM family methyltransferase